MPGKQYFSLKEIATITGSRLSGNPEHLICGAADLETATTEDASFFSNARYSQALKKSKAGVIFIDLKSPLEPQRNYLISEQPSRAFQLFLDTLHPPDNNRSGFLGIHPTAVVHESATIGKNVSIGPCAVIDEETAIGSGTFIGSGSYIGKGSVIGQDCLIHPRVVIREECKIGDRVIVQPGAIIGSCGFGYVTDEHGTHTKLNQIGCVVIEDDVEIGANATIDRARFKETRIGRGSKIDNLVQIAHGVSIGPHNIIIAQTGIAGSSSTGHHVILAGQVAVAGHLHLESGVTVAGKSGVTKSLAAGKYGGIPAIPLDQYNRIQVFLRNIEKYIRELKLVVKKLNQKDS